MLELPLLEVGMQAFVHGLLAEVGHQVVHDQARLHVHAGAVVAAGEVAAGERERLIEVASRVEAVAQLHGIARADDAVAEDEARQIVGDDGGAAGVPRAHVAELQEGVHALVHPRVVALVAAQYAVEPVVAHLVRDHLVERGAAGLADDGDHGVLHAAACADGAVDGRAGIIRVLTHVRAVEAHALVHIGDCLGPVQRVLRGEERPGGHLARAVRQDHASLAHDEALVSEPREVVNAVLHVADGLGGGG